MNRREFIQATAATIVIPTLPTIAKPEPQWVNFTDAIPKAGQKVALLTHFGCSKTTNIATGIVREKGGIYDIYPPHTIPIELGFSYSPDYFNGHDIEVYGLLIHGEDRINPMDLTWKALHANWIEGTKMEFRRGHCIAPRHGLKVSRYIGRDEAWWIPIDDYVPQTLPPIPPVRKKWLGYKNGYQMLIKA